MAGAIGATHVHADEPVRRKLYAAIDALPPGYRTVFVLHEIEGFSHAEIARSLGVSESTSQGQLFRARAKLRESLSSLAGELRS
jgi:RNA polymerase sigma-70 factor (ECF subfamily)